MQKRKVLCTGNPNKPYTIASAVQKIFPETTFIYKSNGYDLLNIKDEQYNDLIKLFSSHNTFINASYIGPYVQNKLLSLCNNSCKICDVFNIGSTHEYDGLGSNEYTNSKKNLQELSLKYKSYRFKTCHIIVGKIQKQLDNGNNQDICVSEICDIIQWVINQRFDVPLISLDQPKKPW